MQKASLLAERIVHKRVFEYFIIGLILVNGAILGLGTSQTVERQFGSLLHYGNQLILFMFILEALLKMLAHSPRVDNYFRDGWNVFDFLVIIVALVPATGDYAMIARLARLLRVLRLISAVMELRLIVAALVRSIPSVGHVMLLMGIIVYIYAIIGYQLFHEHDPMHWRSLGVSVLTLFNIITLEGWTVVMDNAMQLHSWAWVYFVSYVVIATFVVINLFVAIIINNLDQANAERLRELEPPVTREELLRELRSTRDALRRLEHRLDEEGVTTRGDGADDDGEAEDAEDSADNIADKKQNGRE